MCYSILPLLFLGLLLHFRQLGRVQVHRLPMWKGRFLNRVGRLKLVNSVRSSIPTYFLTIFNLKKWALKKMHKIRRGFLWKGTDNVSGGHCLVRWTKVLKPKAWGGLGVLDFVRFSRALRLRWLWFEWVEPDRPWVGTEVPCDEIDRLVPGKHGGYCGEWPTCQLLGLFLLGWSSSERYCS